MEYLINVLNDFKRLPVLRKFSIGMMMGIAIVWVLMRRDPHEPNAPPALPYADPFSPPEIDITEPRLPLSVAPLENLPEPQADDFSR